MNYALHIIVMINLTVIMALGYNLVFGRGKILHFGPEAVSLGCAYGIFLVQQSSHSFLLGLLAGAAIGTALSLLFAWLALRLESDALGILTIATHLAAIAIVLNWTSVTRGALGVPQIPRMPGLETLGGFAIVTTVVAALWILFMLWVDRSPLARALSTLAENRFHAESLGISRARVYCLTFLICGAGSFLSNIFFPQYIGLLHPNDYTFSALVFFLMVVVAGKPGSVLGVTLSAVLLVILKEMLRFLPLPYNLVGPLRLVLFGLILIIAVYVRRKELFPKPRTI